MAAGLGFKDFVTGEVLTAADVDGYLMQGIWVFANAAARDAAVTSPQEGNACYLKDTDAVMTYSGSAWVSASAPASYGSSAGKNAIINAGMEVWQRGTSISVSASSAPYTTDRWVFSTGASAASTVSRQATSDTTNLPTIQYCARVQRNSGQTGTSANYFAQSLETINSIRYVGQSVSLSFYARKGANFSGASDLLGAFLVSGTGTDQNVITAYTGTATVATSNVTLTTTWQRFTITGTVATTATELAAYFSYTPSGTASTNDYYEITGVQLELGSSATTFNRNTSTYALELAACQRYYWRWVATAAYGNLGGGYVSFVTNAQISVNNPVYMRTTPSSVEYANIRINDITGASFTASAVTFESACNNPTVSVLNVTIAGATAARSAFIQGNNNTAAYVGVSAEL
jgi:hypothetical protein